MSSFVRSAEANTDKSLSEGFFLSWRFLRFRSLSFSSLSMRLPRTCAAAWTFLARQRALTATGAPSALLFPDDFWRDIASTNEESEAAKVVGSQIFGSLEEPIKSVRELNMEQACLMAMPEHLRFTKRCLVFLSKLEDCRDHVRDQIAVYEAVPEDWMSVLTLIEQITELFTVLVVRIKLADFKNYFLFFSFVVAISFPGVDG